MRVFFFLFFLRWVLIFPSNVPKELHAPGGVFVALTSLGLQGCYNRPNSESVNGSGLEMWMGIPPSTAWCGFPTHAWF